MNNARALVRPLNLFSFFVFVFIFINTLSAFAGPSRTTYQAKIVKPDGYPLEGTNINFKFTILDTSGSCILYSETYSAVNMGSSGGLVSFSLGSGVRTFPVSGSTFEQVFSNSTASLTCDAGGPANYSPAANDTRKIVMQFNDGAGWQTLPAMTINAVPYAMYANDSLKFNGKDITDFVQVASLPTCSASEAVRFNGAGFSCVAVGGASTSVTSGAVLTALGYTPADGASVTTLSANVSSVSSTIASLSSTVYSVSSTVTSLQNSVAASFAAITSSQWTTSGTNIFYSGTGNVGIGTSNPTSVFQVGSVSAFMVDANSNLSLNGAPFPSAPLNRGIFFSNVQDSAGAFAGRIGFSTPAGVPGLTFYNNQVQTRADLRLLTQAGGLAFGAGTTSAAPSVQMVLTVSGNVGIGTTTPAAKLDVSGAIRIGVDNSSCTAALAGTLRYNGGAVEYCNGTSWAAFGVSGAGLTLLNGSASNTQTFANGSAGTAPAFNSANGVHTLNIPFASAATTTAGLISYSDYLNFANKQAATSAAVAATLGYTPADSATVTTLSSTVGTVSSTVNTVSNAVTSLQNSTASSFAAITSSQWTTSGTKIYYNTGFVGIGTSAPASLLSVAGDIRTNTQTIISGYGSFGYTSGKGLNMETGGATPLSFGTNGSSRMTVDVSGSVGIGTSSPASLLDVNSGGNSVRIGFNSPAYGVAIDYTGSSGWAREYGFSYSGSKVGSFGLLASVSSPTYLYFNANQSGTITGHSAPQMVLTSAGYLGIGTTTPVAKLQITGGSSSVAPIKLAPGTLLTSPQSGSIEYDGTGFYLTDNSNIRRMIATGSSAGTIDNASVINSTGNISMVPVGSVIVSSTTSSTNSSTGALVVNGGLGVAGAANIAGNLNTSGTLTATGDVVANNMKAYVLSRATPANVDDYIELGRFNYGNRSYNLKITLTIDAATIAITKVYLVPIRYVTTSTWFTLLPISQSVWGPDNHEIDLLPGTFGDANAYLRLRRSAGSVAATANIKIEQDGYAATTFTAMSGTGTDSSATSYFESTAMTQLNGRIGVGVSSPAELLHLHAATGVSRSIVRTSWTDATAYGEWNNYEGATYMGGISVFGSSFSTTAYRNAFVMTAANNNLGSLIFRTRTGGAYQERMNINNNGYVGIGTSSPTSRLQITAGTSSVAPVKLTAGTLLTAPQSGSIEYDGTDYYITDNNNIRRTIATESAAGTLNDISTVSSTAGITLWPAAGNSVVVSSTVASTNSTTGALVVNGGLGVAGAANIGGALNVTGVISGSATIKATGYRASQGVPDAADSSTLGYAFGADGDTGMFSPIVGGGSANGVLAFFSNNSEKMRLTNVGLGIGTTNPTTPLDVVTTGSLTQRLYHVSNSQYDDANLILARARGTSTTPTAAQSGDALGGVYFRGYDGSGISSSSAYIAVSAEENFTGSTKGTSMKFGSTVAGTGSYQEIMRIHSNGFVGIGNTTPNALLQVGPSGSQPANYNIYLASYRSTAGQGQIVGNWAGSNYWGLGPATNSGSDNTIRLGNTSDRTGTWSGTQNLNLVMGGALAVGSATVGTYSFQSVKDFNGVQSQTAAFIGGIDAGYSNTGIYVAQKDNTGLGSANTYLLNVVQNNNSKMLVTGAGNVGIGTINPTQRLTIQATHNTASSTAYTGALLIHDDANNVAAHLNAGVSYNGGLQHSWLQSNGTSGTYPLALQPAGGNVGIGIANPATNLHIRGGASYGALMLGTDGGTSNHHITHETDGSFGIFTGSFGSGTRQLTITSGGAMGVGMGNNVPTYKFQVSKTTSATPAMMISGGFAGGPRIQTYGLDADPLAWMGLGTDMSGSNYELSIYTSAAAQNGKITFGQYNSTNASYTERMRIAGDGKVGIGTNNPQAQLHVAGDVRIVDGNQAAARVLASDANGTAAWKQTIIHGTINSTGNTSNGAQAGSGVSITLPPGRWQITGMGITTPTSCRADFGIRNSATNAVVKYTLMPAATGDFTTATVTGYVDIASTTTYDLYITSRGACASQIHVDNNLWELTATGVAY